MKTAPVRSPSFSDTRSTSTHARQTEDDFDHLVMRASRGDSRAIGAIAVALGPMLLEEARFVLGEYADEDDDVLEEFLAVLSEGRSRFRPARGRAIPWMCQTVRAIAQAFRRDNDWRSSGDT